MKYIVGAVLVIVLAGIGWWLLPQQAQGPTSEVAREQLAPEVEAVLEQKATLLTALAAEPALIAAVRASNTANASLSMADIQRLDTEWRSAPAASSFILQFMNNSTAQRLVAFQQEHPEFKEVFIADSRGLNTAQTDKTSDYYQADESWFTESLDNGRGRTFHGDIEFDESSQTEAISVYVPVRDGSVAIGVIKGVVDLAAVSREL